MRRVRVTTLVFFAVAVAACGLAKPMPPFDTFAHQLSDGTVALYWNCTRPSAEMVRMEGWANNPYYSSAIRDLAFILYGVNAQDRTVSQVKASAQSYMIRTNDPSSFVIEMKRTGGEARYDLVYEYWGGGGAGVGLRGGGDPRQQNMARDVCKGLAP